MHPFPLHRILLSLSEIFTFDPLVYVRQAATRPYNSGLNLEQKVQFFYNQHVFQWKEWKED